MTIRAELADGTVLEFPDGTSPDVIQGAVKKLMAEKPVSDQEQIAQERTRLQQELAAQTGPFEAAAIGAGRGLTTLARGAGLAEPESELTTQAFEELQRQRPISTTIGEIAGEAAPFLLPGGLVAKAATIPGRVAAAGAVGAAEAGLIARGRGAEDVQTLGAAGVGGAIAGGLELALPVLGRLGGRLIRNVTGKSATAPILKASGEPSAELLETLDKAGLSIDDLGLEAQRMLETGDIADPAALGRLDFLESQGIVPTRAQITGEATDFQAQQEIAKTSGRVRRALGEQETVLAGRFENAVTATGGSANRSNSTAVDFIADRSIDLDAAISNAYAQAREIAPTEKIVQLDGLSKSLSAIKDFEKTTGGLPSAVRGLLKNRGLLDSRDRLITTSKKVTKEIAEFRKKIGKLGSVITENGDVVNAFSQKSQTLTDEFADLNQRNTGRLLNPAESEALRVDMNALFDSLTPLGKRKLSSLKNALDLDVEKAVGSNVFEGARAAKAKFEKDLSRAKVNKFDTRKKNLVRDILENKVNPDRFLDDGILSKSIRSADVEQLKRFMLLDGDGPGLDAWNDVRAEAMQRIRDTAFNEVGGELALSRSGMEKALDRFGRDKLRVLFSREERKFLDDMLKTSKLREPKRGTALGRGPSAQAVSRLENVVKRIPLLNDVFEGLVTGVAGRAALRQPKLTERLAPSQATRFISPAAAALPATIQAEEQQ